MKAKSTSLNLSKLYYIDVSAGKFERNCQGFFHSDSNCFLPHRCVKGSELHDIGTCSLPKTTPNEKGKIILCVVQEIQGL